MGNRIESEIFDGVENGKGQRLVIRKPAVSLCPFFRGRIERRTAGWLVG
jgi:hypothetical protein